MKTFLVVLGLIALVIIGAVFLHVDAGFVSVNFLNTDASAPLVYVFFGILIAFFAFYLLLRLIGALFRAPSSMGKAKNRRALEAASQRLVSGTLDISEGQYERAETVLVKDVPNGPAGVLHYLAAADAAEAQAKPEYVERYLKRAAEHHQGAKFGIDLKRAEQSMRAGATDKALESARALVKTQARNPRALALLAQSLAATGNWEELAGQFKDLRKFSSLNATQVAELEIQSAKALLTGADDKQLETVWRGLSADARAQSDLLQIYAARQQAAGNNDAAERTLRTALEANWDESLLPTYSSIAANPEQQLTQLQKWIDTHGESAALLEAAGQVSVSNELWGKAHSYLEQAASLSDSPSVQQALAKIADSKGDGEAARTHLQRGLELALQS